MAPNGLFKSEERNSGIMMAFIDINAMQNVAFSFEFVS